MEKLAEGIYRQTVLGWPLEARIESLGGEYLITLTGGSRRHVGSISVAEWSEEGAALHKLLLPSHRDDVVSDAWAGRLCRLCHAKVTVVCGIHYDAVSKDEISQIVREAETLLDKICAQFS